jgi:predicted double-glycine peptidase
MNLWLAAITATLFACCGIGSGFYASRLPRFYWTLGYLLPAAVLLVYGLANHLPAFAFAPPISWMMMGRKKFAIMGFIAAMVLTTPLSRVPKRRDRMIICLFMAVMIFSTTVWPFVVPAFDRSELVDLQTHLDPNGVCIQSTDYTCGPAAAVTALRRLGFSADEGRLAILSETSSATGTPPDMLVDALQDEYGSRGLVAQCRQFRSISELRQTGLTLAMIKYSFMVDHWVAVLQVTDSEVIVGDPLSGKVAMSWDQFARKWRFVGITLKRKS